MPEIPPVARPGCPDPSACRRKTVLKPPLMTQTDTKADPITAPAGLPGVDRLLQDARLADLPDRVGRSCVVEAARTVLEEARSRLLAGGRIDADGLADRVVAHVAAATAPSLRPVLNLTGTVVHTNLGRSALPETAVEAMTRAARQAGRSGIRSGGREARRPRRPPRSPHPLPDRRGGGHGGQQQCRRRHAGAEYAGQPPRRPGLARRAGRDRRRPSACRTSCAGPARALSRSERDQQDPSERLRRGDSGPSGARSQGPYQQL